MPENKFYSLWISLIIIGIFILQATIPGFSEIFLLDQSSFLQLWRFITSIFLHGSLTHLIYNLFALIFFGLILEKFIGSKKFLIVFFISGILANILSVNFYESSLGASGAIFGIIGALTVLKPMITVFAFSLPMPLFLASILWALGDMLGIFMPSNIANLAHLAGLLVGLISGFILRKKTKNPGISYKIKIPEQHMRNWESSYMR